MEVANASCLGPKVSLGQTALLKAGTLLKADRAFLETEKQTSHVIRAKARSLKECQVAER